jgi:uncharacterized YigZ family protein
MSWIVSNSAKASTKHKRSEFISYLLPLSHAEDAASQIKNLKQKHPAANHICWAYRVMCDSNLEEFNSDAGEPTGTAGLPIMTAMQKSDLVNSILAVVRLFGGIKLGRSGLKMAYREAAQKVVEAADLIAWVPTIELSISCQYERAGDLSIIVNRLHLKPRSESSHDLIVWKIEIPVKNEQKITSEIMSAMQGKVFIEKV